MTDELSQEGFISRWSRLKQNGDDEQALTESVKTEPLNALVADESAAEVEEEVPPLTDVDMPDVETLNEDSDFTGFLSEGVSDALRSKAMRKLFHLPEFNIRDGLNDYDDDFSTFIPLGDTVTYQMKQWLEQEANEAKAKLLEAEGEHKKAEDSSDKESPDELDLDDSKAQTLSLEDSNEQFQSNSYDELLEDLGGELDEDSESELG
ncbi:MAG: DUF3306 domain-containing protein [Motiliproteus sp.]